MASFNYMNNTAPFWDFIASVEQQGNNHPLFGRNRQDRSNDNEHGEDHEGHRSPPFDPWTWSHQLFGGPGGLPHRGPPPPQGCHDTPPHHDSYGPHHEHGGGKDGEKSDNDNDHDNDNDNINDNDNANDKDNRQRHTGSGSDNEGGRHYGRARHGRCGSRRGRHGFGGRGGFGLHHGGPGHHGPPHEGPGRGHRSFHYGSPPPPEDLRSSSHGHGPRGHHHPGRPGGRGAWGCDRSFDGGADFNPASIFAPFFDAFVAERSSNKNNEAAAKDDEDFSPEADVFDTISSYFIHVSLPGAKKEDVGVNWDAEKSELSVAGVIYRPGDEELLKTLAMNERKVGPFERRIRLGSRANPPHVDADGITAKLEDGVLRIEVRKEDEGFVEIKKVDIE